MLIADIGMPGMDGLQLIRALRQMEEPARSMPAAALTAYARSHGSHQMYPAEWHPELGRVAAGDTLYDATTGKSATINLVDAAGHALLLNANITTAGDIYVIQKGSTFKGTAGDVSNLGVLEDTTADFSTVAAGDIAIDTTNPSSTTVQFVDAANHELILNSSAFAPGDSYQIVTPAAVQGTAQNAGDIGVLQAPQNFSSVHVGDTVTDTTTSKTAVVLVVDPAAHQLVLNNGIFTTGDAYSVDAISGTAQDTSHVMLDLSANFHASAVIVGDTVENLTATAANNNVPVTADITAVGIHQLTLTRNAGSFFAPNDSYLVDPHGSLSSGAGGIGNLQGAGGAGGNILLSSVVAPGNVHLTAGHGGSGGATGAAGAGGTMSGGLNGDGALSAIGSASLTAGDAGATGGKAGAGGSISLANIQAFSDISFIAGNGTAGGAGGSITGSGFSGAYQAGAFSPSSGNLLIQAGAGGSSPAGKGGAGGSISTLTGFVSNGEFDGFGAFTNRLAAGPGGDGASKGGAGGSLNGVNIFGGGGFNVTLFMDAGDAGNATTAKVGAAGGSISNIGVGTQAGFDPIFSLDPGTNFHHLSAGNGGNTTLSSGKGGPGGSVTGVHVNAAIGARTGKAFGFDLGGMGGISAGAGGTGGSVTAHGLAGNVTNISADAIASIVAGHLKQGDGLFQANLVNTVDGIILNGTNAPVPARFPFTLSYGGQVTPLLPGNASNIDVATALNALSTVQAKGGVGVTNNPSGGFLVLFQAKGTQTDIGGTEDATVQVAENIHGAPFVQDVQELNVLGLGQFTLTYGGATTPLLGPSATPGDIQTALDNLTSSGSPTIKDGVTVTKGANPNNDFVVTFNDPGARTLLTGTEFIPLAVNNSVGSANTQASETVTFPAQGVFDPIQFASANLVGGIADIHRQNAVVFHAKNVPPGTFVFGNAPIDGLIAAVTMTANKNFVPEAFVTVDASGNTLFRDNLIS